MEYPERLGAGSWLAQRLQYEIRRGADRSGEKAMCTSNRTKTKTLVLLGITSRAGACTPAAISSWGLLYRELLAGRLGRANGCRPLTRGFQAVNETCLHHYNHTAVEHSPLGHDRTPRENPHISSSGGEQTISSCFGPKRYLQATTNFTLYIITYLHSTRIEHPYPKI